MSIFHSAWKTTPHAVVTLIRFFVAPVRLILSRCLAERGRCRAIADLEALPRTLLNDIGVHRVQIPLVVCEAIREQRGPGNFTLEAVERDDAPPVAETGETASRTSVA